MVLMVCVLCTSQFWQCPGNEDGVAAALSWSIVEYFIQFYKLIMLQCIFICNTFFFFFFFYISQVEFNSVITSRLVRYKSQKNSPQRPIVKIETLEREEPCDRFEGFLYRRDHVPDHTPPKENKRRVSDMCVIAYELSKSISREGKRCQNG